MEIFIYPKKLNIFTSNAVLLQLPIRRSLSFFPVVLSVSQFQLFCCWCLFLATKLRLWVPQKSVLIANSRICWHAPRQIADTIQFTISSYPCYIFLCRMARCSQLSCVEECLEGSEKRTNFHFNCFTFFKVNK